MKSTNKGKCSQPWETETGIFENRMRNTQQRIPIQEIGRFEIFVRLSAIFETSLKLIEFPMKRTRLDLFVVR